jgi:hypothetical protein
MGKHLITVAKTWKDRVRSGNLYGPGGEHPYVMSDIELKALDALKRQPPSLEELAKAESEAGLHTQRG